VATGALLGVYWRPADQWFPGEVSHLLRTSGRQHQLGSWVGVVARLL